MVTNMINTIDENILINIMTYGGSSSVIEHSVKKEWSPV